MKIHHLTITLLLCCGLVSTPGLNGAQLTRAKVTQTHNEVQILPGSDTPRPAAVGDVVEGQTAVRTGKESRTELQFTDNTIARLGALSLFSFTQGTRDIDLKEGTILLRVPKNAGGAKVKTAAVTAGITGTTVLISVLGGVAKFIVLEGTMRISIPGRPGESMLIEAGQMIILPLDATVIPEPVEVNLELLVKTSKLIKDFGPLPSFDLINTHINDQSDALSKGDLVKTNLVILGRGTRMLFSSIDHINEQSRIVIEDADPEPEPKKTPEPQGGGTPPPSSSQPNPPKDKPPEEDGPKYGTPPVYTGTFNVTGDTLVITDPVIQTSEFSENGVIVVEHEGKIYRGVAQDGPADSYVLGPGTHGLAGEFNALVTAAGETTVYRFEQLMITGTPEYNTTGGPTNVALVGLNGLTVDTYNYYDDYYGDDFYAEDYSGDNFDFAPLGTMFLVTNAGPLLLTNSNINPSGRNLVLYSQGNATIEYSDIDTESNGSLQGLFAGNSNSISNSIIGGNTSMTALGSLSVSNSILNGPSIFLKSVNQDVTLSSDFYGYYNTSLGGPNTSSIQISAGGNITTSGWGEGRLYMNATSVQLEAQQQIDLSQTNIGPDGEGDTTPQTVTLTSKATSGEGITISNSSQILAALEGGTVTMTTEGANITVNSSSIEAENVLLRAGGESSSSVIAMHNTSIAAAQRVFLYAGNGPNGKIQFNPGNTEIRSGAGTIMAARTLQVEYGAQVDFTGAGEVYFFGQNINNDGTMLRNGSTPEGTPQPSGPYGNRPVLGSQGTVNGLPMFRP